MGSRSNVALFRYKLSCLAHVAFRLALPVSIKEGVRNSPMYDDEVSDRFGEFGSVDLIPAHFAANGARSNIS